MARPREENGKIEKHLLTPTALEFDTDIRKFMHQFSIFGNFQIILKFYVFLEIYMSSRTLSGLARFRKFFYQW